jgi:hypothetical protein
MDPENNPQSQTPPAETPPVETPPVETPPAEPTEDDLPEWARKELTKVRNEAAGYRTRLRDAEDKLKDAKTPEEFQAAMNEWQTKNSELERNLLVTKIATKHGLPEAIAARLQGGDEAAIEADALALAALIVAPRPAPESLSGGLNPGESDDEFDPVKAAHAAKRRRF